MSPARKKKGGWVLVPPERVPERWKGRGQVAVLIPLLDDETENVLASGSTEPSLDPIDERIVHLLLRGRSITQIATEVGISERTVKRRLSHLRSRYELHDKTSFHDYFSGL